MFYPNLGLYQGLQTFSWKKKTNLFRTQKSHFFIPKSQFLSEFLGEGAKSEQKTDFEEENVDFLKTILWVLCGFWV